jgi:ribosomal-protein-alanine N-acetyltransferase
MAERPSPERPSSSMRAAPPLLRAATPDDVDAVTDIERASFADPWARASFASLLRRAEVRFRVAEREGAVAGYSIAWFVRDEGELANVAVAPSARGQGVGGALLDELLADAATAGVRVVYLEVRESNAVARALYASRGFEEIGRRRNYYRRPVEDALVLRRDASPDKESTATDRR